MAKADAKAKDKTEKKPEAGKKTLKQLKAEQSKARREAKKIEEARKLKAIGDYGERLETVMKLKDMTDTQAWQSFYSDVTDAIEEHGRDVLDAEKSRDVIHHQEGVKILRALMANISEPVQALNSFVRQYPLFIREMPMLAEWNRTLGKVEIRSAS